MRTRLAGLLCALALSTLPVDDAAEQLGRFAQTHPGDAGRGRAVFFDEAGAACVRCHRAEGKGGQVGPDLSDVGGKLDRMHLIESVLYPSRQVVEGYRPTLIATTSGLVRTGLVKQETGQTLTLVDAEAHELTINKAEIEERAYADGSIMPEGLAARLAPERFADLIAYLQGLRSAGQPSPGSGTKGPIVLTPGFELKRIAGGLTAVTALAVSPDGRVFVCEQTGALRVIKDDVLLPAPFVSLTVDSYWERGLIGVALDPGFPGKPYVYVNHVVPEPYPHHRISRFTAEGDTAVPRSEVILFEGDDQTRLGGKVPGGHQGGAIHFGNDGKLYVALGEQTAEMPSQSLESLLGKLLRINADGTIPSDNPFAHETKGKYRAIWALGLRNPFTFAVQPETGRIFVNDVGGVAEEINEAHAGANYGWPAAEHGPVKDSRFQGPIYWYPTASIAGGAFCPRQGGAGAFPETYRGKYFFMDFVKGWIKTLDPDDTRRPAQATQFASGLARPVDLAFGPDGSLYVLLRDAWVRDASFQPHTGALVRIQYQGDRS